MSIRNLMCNVLTCVAMLIGTSAHATDKPDIQVLLFTDRANEFTDDGGYPVIYLDEVLRIEKELTQAVSHFDLSENMKPEELDKVRNQLRRVLDEQALLDAYAGLSLAWSLNVTHIPAIVTRIQGERYLVSYGEYDVPISLVRIRN